jgi:ABC-type oligopeptide transport system substrate-binding subunit/class 3 adenylate cyclase
MANQITVEYAATRRLLKSVQEFRMSGTENKQIEHLRDAIAKIEAQRESLGEEVYVLALASMREKLAILQAESQPAEQQRKLVSMLFMDIVDSSRIGQHMDPEEVLDTMDQALKNLAKPVEDYGGHVTRFMGDGFKAVFGHPITHEDDAERAVRAGLEILRTAREYAHLLEEKRGTEELKVRVGVNTGLVAIGGLTEAEDTVMGSTVNLAARMESAAPPDGLLISHNTYRHVRGLFEVEPLEPIKAKGFDNPIPVYLVKRAVPRPLSINTRGVEGIETQMVGREIEIKYLQDAFDAIIEDGEGQVITITGEAGVGKSRLLYEFQNWLGVQLQETVNFIGQARQETQSLPYALFRDVFTFQFKIQDDDSAAIVRKKVESGFCDVLGQDEYGKLRAHFIGQLMGFDLSESPFLQAPLGNPQQFRNRAIAFLGEYFSVLSARTPVMLFLEDIHWADDSSLHALNYLGRRTPGQRLLILCLARRDLLERRPNWGEGQTYHRSLELSFLSKRESRKLVNGILQKASQVPGELRELIVNRAEGNPFYIEEMIKVLIEKGVIIKGEQRWKVKTEKLAEIDVPSTLTGLLQARLDNLPVEEKTVLQQASVVGRIFWDQVVAYMYSTADKGSSGKDILDILEALRDKEMIFLREESVFARAREYIFKHEMLRQVTYETVLKKSRSAYHGLVADWLIENSAERAGEVTGLIADHLEHAGRTDEAIHYLLDAGDRARTLYAHEEAADNYQRAIQLLKDTGDRERAAQALMKLGLTYHTAFAYELSSRAYQEGFDLWQSVEGEHPEVEQTAGMQELRMAWSDPPSLDPTMGGTNWMAPIVTQLFSGLVGQSPEMEVVPDVAQSWEMLEEGRKYVFHLREGIYWSDGVPVTAGDFEFTFKRALDPGTKAPVAGLLLYGIKNARAFHQGEISDPNQIGVCAPDDTTLVIELEEPTGYFMQDLSYYVLLPVPRHVVDAFGAAWAEPENIVTNGPFRLVAWKRNGSMVLQRNPHYHGRFKGNAERIHLTLGLNSTQQFERYKAGELDLIYNWFFISSEIDDLRNQYSGDYIHRPRFVTIYLLFEISRPPFDDLRVRQAFVRAIDRETLANVLFKGYELAGTGGFVPPGMPGYSPDIGLAYDPVQARRLLGEAGYSSERPLPTISCLAVPAREMLASYLRTQWRNNLKVETQTEIVDPLTFINRLSADRPPALINAWWADYADPDNFLRVCVQMIAPHWRNKSFEGLLEQARRISDQKERLKLYQQADRLLTEEAVLVPLVYSQLHMMLKPWVRNFPTTAIKNPGFLKDVIIEPH